MNKTTDAVKALLGGNLEEAIKINERLLANNPKDIEILNRLAFAYCSLGDGKKARLFCKRVLRLDPLNQIALKNIKKTPDALSHKKKFNPLNTNNLFIEEIGKTKVTTLVNTAEPKKLKELQIGQSLNLIIKRSKIFMLMDDKNFIGKLPDNISVRLIKFIKGGNKYGSYVKSVNEKNIQVFIKEIKQVTKFKNQPSFITTTQIKSKLNFSKKSSQNYLKED